MSNLITLGFEVLLYSYRLFLSPFLHHGLPYPSGCRFIPTCSAYGVRALRQYGLLSGGVVLARRFLRCHPGGPFGHDPLPDRDVALP